MSRQGADTHERAGMMLRVVMSCACAPALDAGTGLELSRHEKDGLHAHVW